MKQKIYDEIKYLYKVATADSKEARELEQVKKTFEQVYREGGKAQMDTKYSLENENKRNYDKRSRYGETETLFLSWENGSAPVGEVKRFVRFGKVRYYEKTENGCVELSRQQFNERNGENAENTYRRAEREISEAYDHDESTQRGLLGDYNSHRDTGRNAAVFGQTIREELSDDTAGSESGVLGYDSRNDIKQSEYNEEASDESGASFTFSNDYAAIRNFMKEGDTDNEADVAPAMSLSQKGEQSFVPVNRSEVYGKDIALEAPIREAQAVTEKAQTSEQMFPDDNEPVERPVIINKLTNEEIDENTYRILERLDNGDPVTVNELSKLKEVEIGQRKVNELRQNFVSEHPELSNVSQEDIGTYLLNSEKRNRLRENLVVERLAEGSFSGFDKDGNEEYNGSVRYDKRLDIVIGLPASGKSSAIVNPLSEFYQSVVIDSDIIKRRLPEYNDGWGSMLTHEESSLINWQLLEATISSGKNVVLPIVGSKVSSVEKYIEAAKMRGYGINIHLNELPNGKAVGRMLNRYFSDGRFINPAYVAECGDKPTEVYKQIKSRGDINGYSRWNNDVPKGQRPKLIEVSENSRLYGTRNRADRASGGTVFGRLAETVERGTEQNQIAPAREASSKDGVFFDAPVREAVVAEKATVEQMFPDDFAPVEEDIAPVEKPTQNTNAPEVHEAIRPKREPQPRMAKATPAEQARAQVMTEEPKSDKKNPTARNLIKDNIVDKGRLSWTAVTMKS